MVHMNCLYAGLRHLFAYYRWVFRSSREDIVAVYELETLMEEKIDEVDMRQYVYEQCILGPRERCQMLQSPESGQ